MMQEVGSHEGDDDHVCSAADAGHGDAVISDALQDAAQTNVPDSNMPVTSGTLQYAPGYPSGTPQYTAGYPSAPGVPDLTYSPVVDARSPVPSAPVPLSSLPINLSSPSQPPLYQPSPLPAGTLPGSSAPTGLTSGGGGGGGGPPPPPPTEGFIPSHGIVTATPGKHHSSLPMAPPSALSSHIFTPTAAPQMQIAENVVPLAYNSPPAYPQSASTTLPMEYSQGTVHGAYESAAAVAMAPSTYPPSVHSTAPESRPKSEGFFGWLPGSGIMNKVIEKTKSSVETVITTLDPGMKDVIYSGGNINIVVTSTKESKVVPVRQAFQSVFGKATVIGVDSQPNIAPQPVGYSAGVRGAEERIDNLRQSGLMDEGGTVVSIENFIVELLPDKWFDVGCLVLKDARHGVELTTFSQATPVPPECVCAAQDATPSEYPLRWSGLAMTVGQAIQQRAAHVDHTDWHAHVVGMSHSEILSSAARALAGLYRARLVPYDSIL